MAMTVADIKRAIEGLTDDERAQLADWLAAEDAAAWDAQIEHDFSAGGRGAKLLNKVDNQIRRGAARPLSEGPPKP